VERSSAVELLAGCHVRLVEPGDALALGARELEPGARRRRVLPGGLQSGLEIAVVQSHDHGSLVDHVARAHGNGVDARQDLGRDGAVPGRGDGAAGLLEEVGLLFDDVDHAARARR